MVSVCLHPPKKAKITITWRIIELVKNIDYYLSDQPIGRDQFLALNEGVNVFRGEDLSLLFDVDIERLWYWRLILKI